MDITIYCSEGHSMKIDKTIVMHPRYGDIRVDLLPCEWCEKTHQREIDDAVAEENTLANQFERAADKQRDIALDLMNEIEELKAKIKEMESQ